MPFRSLPPAPVGGDLRAIGKIVLAGVFFVTMQAVIRHLADDGIHVFAIAIFLNLCGFLMAVP